MSEGLQIVISADVNQFTKNLQTAENATKSFSKNVSKNAGNANYALQSVSRVAQDLPFGFIAIQNNITPLFDSFGQLVTNSDGVKNAFKSLASSLIGPAGLGLAIGVISGLITAAIQKYGSLSNAINELGTVQTKQQKIQDDINKATNDAAAGYETEISKINLLVSTLTSANSSKTEQINSYRELNKKYPALLENLSLENSRTEAGTKLLKERQAELINYIALKGQEDALTKLVSESTKKELEGKRQFIKGVTVQTNFLGRLIDYVRGYGDASKGALIRQTELADETIDAGQAAKEYGTILENVRKELLKITPQILNFAKPPKSPETFNPLKGTLQTVEQTTSAFKKYIDTLNVVPKAAQGLKITKGVTAELNAETANAVETQKYYTEEYMKTATMIASFITPAIDGLFSSIENGQNAFQALGNALRQLVIDLIKTVAKAAILAAILNIIFPTGSKGATSLGNASGGFGGFFSSLLRLPKLGGTAAPSMGGMAGLQGGMQLAGNVVFVQRGYDLVGVLNASNGSINNIG